MKRAVVRCGLSVLWDVCLSLLDIVSEQINLLKVKFIFTGIHHNTWQSTGRKTVQLYQHVKEIVQPKIIHFVNTHHHIMTNISSVEHKICYLKNLLAIFFFCFVHPVTVIQTNFLQIVFWSNDDSVWWTERNLDGHSLSNQIKTLIHSSILIPKSNTVTHQ